jgi:hypothetical protein
MHATPHNVTATVVIVGIVGGVVRITSVIVVVVGPIESAAEEPSPMMEAVVAVVETAALEAVRRKAAALNSGRTDRGRAREAAAKTPALEAASASCRAETAAAECCAPAAAEATSTTAMATASAAAMTAATSTATAARQGYVWRQHAN